MEKETTYLEAIREAMWEEMKTDDSVFILGEDVGVYGGAFKATQGFLQEFQKIILGKTHQSAVAEGGDIRVAGGIRYQGLFTETVVGSQFGYRSFTACRRS